MNEASSQVTIYSNSAYAIYGTNIILQYILQNHGEHWGNESLATQNIITNTLK